MTAPLPDSEIEGILVVAAHPDDIDFGAAGTVAHWTDAGISVVYCVVTDGQSGGFDLDFPREKVAEIRRAEQRSAAALVGVDDVRFLGHVDGELTVTSDVVREVTATIREVRPDRMLVPSTERDWARIYRSHPDHLAAGEATVQAIYPAARNPFAFPALLQSGLQPWTVRETWLMAHPRDNHAVDVTETFDRKIAAILAHESQHPQPEEIADRMRLHLTAAAERNSMGPDRLAEGFYVVPTG
ncbi:MAG: PIG-L family deacetylase [Actinomycetota bacterium]|nr:PIG-L family deacetylase [Actinomycetota bacterium]